MKWLALTVVSLAFAASVDADQIDELVARFIASEVQRLGGSEYEEARSIKRSVTSGHDQISVAKTDAACCPSLEGTSSYQLAAGRLVEERPRAGPRER